MTSITPKEKEDLFMKQLRLEPVVQVRGEINIPGSKSISNRALLLATLAKGTTTLTNLLDSDDIRHMLASLKQLGVEYSLSQNNTVCELIGLGGTISADSAQTLFLGNAGTAMRPLCAALTLGRGEFTLTGEPRMEERPIGDLVDALRQLGANVVYLKNDGFPPLTINATGLNGGDVEIAGGIDVDGITVTEVGWNHCGRSGGQSDIHFDLFFAHLGGDHEKNEEQECHIDHRGELESGLIWTWLFSSDTHGVRRRKWGEGSGSGVILGEGDFAGEPEGTPDFGHEEDFGGALENVLPRRLGG